MDSRTNVTENYRAGQKCCTMGILDRSRKGSMFHQQRRSSNSNQRTKLAVRGRGTGIEPPCPTQRAEAEFYLNGIYRLLLSVWANCGGDLLISYLSLFFFLMVRFLWIRPSVYGLSPHPENQKGEGITVLGESFGAVSSGGLFSCDRGRVVTLFNFFILP